MRSVLLAAAIAGAWLSAVAAEEAGNADRAERLIARLGSGAFRDRETATRELDALGPTALDALRRAAVSADAETRRRAADLVRRIDERVASARILTATLVEFDYKERPLDEAVRDLARKGGGSDVTNAVPAISLHAIPATRFHGRRITAATPGKIPFWEAVDLFCRKAGLHEWDGFAKLDGQPSETQAAAQWNGQMIQGQVIIAGRMSRQPVRQPSGVVLLDGAGPTLPTCRTGAFRVRAAPPGTAVGVIGLGSDEVMLPLQMSAEPRLRWQGAMDVRVERAVDDRGQALAAVAAAAEPAIETGEMMVVNNMIVPVQAHRGGPVGVRVRRGEKPATRLTELAGTIAGQVRITEPVAVLDDPLKVGQSAHGSAGVSLKVTSAKRSGSGDITVGVEVNLPLDVHLTTQTAGNVAGFAQFGGGVVINGGGRIVAAGGGIGPSGQPPALPSGTTENMGLSLEDAKGRRFAAIRGGPFDSQRFGGDGVIVYQFTTVFKPAEESQPPARLVFAASRSATIEIPFALKDIPLP
jgi:hypothetical protein